LNFLAPSTQIAMIMNKPFFANISPQGKILSIKENKSIAKEFEAKTKKLSPDLREQVYTMVNALVGNESLVALIKSWTSYIPDSAVKIGDKWSIQKDSSVTNYAFITETDSTYVIEGVGNRKTTMTNKIQGMVLIVNYEEEFTTTIEIDKHTFLPKIITTESEVLTKSEMPDYPTFSMPPSQSYSTSTLKISNCR